MDGGVVGKMYYVVLDLDSTLIYSRRVSVTEHLEEDERNFYTRPSHGGVFKTTKRKHLNFFLDELKRKGYKVIVWSAGGAPYVKDIVSVLFRGREEQLEYLFTNVHLTNDRKDLRTIEDHIPGFRVENARLIDDNAMHRTGQEAQVMTIPPFYVEGDQPTEEEDDDLLETLVDSIGKDFRKPDRAVQPDRVV
jgi:hypothetical protein